MDKNDYTYKILGNKMIEISNQENRKLRFKLKQKRAFFVFQKLVEKYPDYLNLHDLDSYYSDPNKAYSELKLTDGFQGFVSEKRGMKKVIMARLELDKLFNQYHPADPDTFIDLSSVDSRINLTKKEKDTIFNDFNGKCNITGIKLNKKSVEKSQFMNRLISPSYDHRTPLFAGGNNTIGNIQLLSAEVNQEKNRMCVSCKTKKCKVCALAYPEKYSTIQANFQDISDLKK